MPKADEILKNLDENKFASLTIGEPQKFGTSVKPVPREVCDIVEALYDGFNADPDNWYPLDLGSEKDLDEVVMFMRTYCQSRSAGRLTLSVRREQPPSTKRWFRVAGYVKRTRS